MKKRGCGGAACFFRHEQEAYLPQSHPQLERVWRLAQKTGTP
jgi:hypothetical protein